MNYAYTIFRNGELIEVFLGDSEGSEDVQDFCRKIDARWASTGHHKYTMSKGSIQFTILKTRVTKL